MAKIELGDTREKLQRESLNGTFLAQSVQQLESKLHSATSKAEELEGSLAGSRSERERLSASLKDAEVGPSFFLLDGVPSVSRNQFSVASEATT